MATIVAHLFIMRVRDYWGIDRLNHLRNEVEDLGLKNLDMKF